MCNRYVSPAEADIERYWQLSRSATGWLGGEVFPRAPGPFVRVNSQGVLELVVGQWALVPHFAKSAKLTYTTNNARAEEVAQKASFRGPWLRGQRCLIPAWTFDEPCWETGRNVWWTFARVDGAPWGLAGLWNTWVDRATGEVVESYTMLTVNADHHPLMRRMHKPKPKLGPHEQDKRSVVAIEPRDEERWLYGSRDEVHDLLQPPAMSVIKTNQDGG